MKQQGFIGITTIILMAIALCFVVFIVPYIIVQNNRQYFVSKAGAIAETLDESRIAIVPGSGLYPSGTPRPVLAERLNTAIRLYDLGSVSKILVSGHQEPFYDEPAAMRSYLIENGVSAEAIISDPKGVSTQATCGRATQVYGVKQAIIVTQQSHLARAIYLCRAEGMKAYGFVAPSPSSTVTDIFQWFREGAANIEAVFEVITNSKALYNN
jgi:SanA protein